MHHKQYTFSVNWSESEKIFIGQCHEEPLLKCKSDSEETAIIGVLQLVIDNISQSIP